MGVTRRGGKKFPPLGYETANEALFWALEGYRVPKSVGKTG